MQIEAGKQYKRSPLHEACGGNRQGGITRYAKNRHRLPILLPAKLSSCSCSATTRRDAF